MILKLVVIIIVIAGALAALLPRMPGTVIIFFGAILYGIGTEFSTFNKTIVTALLAIMVATEGGCRFFRMYFTQKYPITRRFSTDTTVGNIAGLIAAEAVLGPTVGFVLWEITAAKSWVPRLDVIAGILIRLTVIACMRIFFSVLMIILIIKYIFI